MGSSIDGFQEDIITALHKFNKAAAESSAFLALFASQIVEYLNSRTHEEERIEVVQFLREIFRGEITSFGFEHIELSRLPPNVAKIIRTGLGLSVVHEVCDLQPASA